MLVRSVGLGVSLEVWFRLGLGVRGVEARRKALGRRLDKVRGLIRDKETFCRAGTVSHSRRERVWRIGSRPSTGTGSHVCSCKASAVRPMHILPAIVPSGSLQMQCASVPTLDAVKYYSVKVTPLARWPFGLFLRRKPAGAIF